MKIKRVLLAGWLVAGLFAAATGAAAQDQSGEESADGQVQPERVVYKQTSDAEGEPVELSLHMFKPEGWSADDKRPAVMFFFGGGWNSGTPKQFYPHSRELSARGMVAFAAEYRVKSRNGTPPQACVEDGKSAVRYLRQHADTLGIDPGMIIASGGSAGGHVAACTGTIRGFEAEGEDHDISSKPQLMILFNPVIDTSPQTGYGANRLGDDPLSISPLNHVTKDQPPTLIMHGDADTTTPIGSQRVYAKRCEEVGAECVLVEYEGVGHGFFNHKAFRKPKAGSPDYYAMTMQAVDKFLTRHGVELAPVE